MRPRVLLAVCMMTCAAAVLAQDPSPQTVQQSTPTIETAAAASTRDADLALAREHLLAGRHSEAARIARRLLEKDSMDADARSIRDEAAKQRETAFAPQIAEAETRARASDAADTDRLALADVYFEAGRYKDAASTYGKVQGSTMTREARMRQARALSWSGRMHEAEPIYASLLAEERSPELELEYGRMLSWMGASDASMKRLQAVYDASPTEEAAIALANAHAWNGNRDAAITLLRDYTSTHDAAEATALLQELESSPHLRIERLDRTIAAEPNNLALRMQRARLLLDANRYSEALREAEFIREHWSDPVDGLEELERQARERREADVKLARERLHAIDRKDVTRAEEMLALARAFTAAAEYDESIELYEDYLALRPDDIKARHDYARVLSWDRRWAAAERQYKRILDEQPDRADIRLEYAQVLSYDSNYAAAMPMFSSLTDLSENKSAYLYSEVPPRAHYNLGQIYRWYGWNDHAAEHQNHALELDDGYLPARDELERARHGRPGSTFSTRFTTATNSNDFTLRRVDLEGELWRNQKTALQLAVGRHQFDHHDTTVEATSVSGGMTYRTNDRMTLRGRLGATLYEESLGTRPFWGIGAAWTPNLQSRAALDYNRYDLIYDVFTLSSLTPVAGPQLSPTDPISIDDLRGHYDYNSGGLVSALGDVSYGFISDENRRASAHGILSFRIWREPFVALKADAHVLSYDQRTDRYWSPTDYHSLAGVLQVGQNVRDRFFWTAELKFGKAWDDDRESDLRAYAARITVPINDVIDAVGSWSYGRSGQLDSILGTSGNDNVTYWQRSWYVGVRLKRLFMADDRRDSSRYYFDNRQLGETSPAASVTETQP